jgi:quinol monooxygenase YgiN
MSEVCVVVCVRVKPGQVEQFLKIFRANVPNVLAEDVASGMAAQELAPEVVTILERWASLDALKAHSEIPHMLAYREQVKDIVEEVSLKVLRTV